MAAKRTTTNPSGRTLDGVKRPKPTASKPAAKPVAKSKPKKPVAHTKPVAATNPELYTASDVNSDQGGFAMNVQAMRPKRHKWIRHVLVLILVSALVLAVWLAYTSATHKVL